MIHAGVHQMKQCRECATETETWSYCVLCFDGCQHCAREKHDTLPAPPPEPELVP
jgi:hypothetical protein